MNHVTVKKKRDEQLLARCIAAARDVNRKWVAVAKEGCPPANYEEPSQTDLDLAVLHVAEMIYKHVSRR